MEHERRTRKGATKGQPGEVRSLKGTRKPPENRPFSRSPGLETFNRVPRESRLRARLRPGSGVGKILFRRSRPRIRFARRNRPSDQQHEIPGASACGPLSPMARSFAFPDEARIAGAPAGVVIRSFYWRSVSFLNTACCFAIRDCTPWPARAVILLNCVSSNT